LIWTSKDIRLFVIIMMTTLIDFPKWTTPGEDEAVDALPFCNDTTSDFLLKKFKDVNFDIESFISERVCEFADEHKAKQADDSQNSEGTQIVLKKTYFCEKLATLVVASEKLKKTSPTGQHVYKCII